MFNNAAMDFFILFLWRAAAVTDEILKKFQESKSLKLSNSRALSLSLSTLKQIPQRKNGVPTSPELGGGSEAFFPLLSKVTLAPTQRLAVT